MLNRPFLPFRVRPIHTAKVRPATLQPADLLAAAEDLKPLSVKAERRSIKGLAVATANRPRVPVRGTNRIG
jgi:hypothetical protein